MKKIILTLNFLLCFAAAMATDALEQTVMLTTGSTTPRVTDVTYNGISRRMYLDDSGCPICHISYYNNFNSQDTAFFSTDGTYIAATKNSVKFPMIQDGSTNYLSHKSFLELNSDGLDILSGSEDEYGNWTSADTRGRHRTHIERSFFYGADPELDAEISSLEARRDSFLAEYQARNNNWQSNKTQGWISFILLGIIGAILTFLSFKLSAHKKPSTKYIIRTALGLPGLLMCWSAIAAMAFVAAVGGSSFGTAVAVIATPVLIAMPVVWFFIGRSFFRKMGMEKSLSNTFILTIEIIWTVFLTLPLTLAACSTLIPIPFIGSLIGFAAAFLIFLYQDVVLDRCPDCRNIYAYDEVGRTREGTLTDVSKDSDESVSDPVRVGDHLERQRRRTDTTTTSVYQRWRVHSQCRYCGHQRSFTKVGELLSQIKHKKVTDTTERSC